MKIIWMEKRFNPYLTNHIVVRLMFLTCFEAELTIFYVKRKKRQYQSYTCIEISEGNLVHFFDKETSHWLVDD